MAISPASQHRASVEAEKKQTQAKAMQSPARHPQYRAYFHKMNSDLQRLQKQPSKRERNLLKAELLPEYDDYIRPLISAGTCGKHNDIFAWTLIWCADAGRYDQALDMLPVALADELSAPRRFSTRRLPEIVVEDIAKAVIQHQEPHTLGDVLHRLEAIAAPVSMPDYIKAKLYKALGFSSMQQDSETALKWFSQSYDYNPQGGVVSHVKRLKKQIERGNHPPRRKGSRPLKSVNDAAKAFDLSTRQAAAMFGISYQSFNKIVQTHPDKFDCLEVPYGKGTMKRYKSSDVRAYIDTNIIKRSNTMTAQTIQDAGLKDLIIGHVQFDAIRALKHFPNPAIAENIRDNFTFFWVNNQLDNAAVDFTKSVTPAELKPVLESLCHPEPVGKIKAATKTIIDQFEQVLPGEKGIKFRAYLADKFLMTLMDMNLLEPDAVVRGRVADFEYPEPDAASTKTDC